MVLVFGSLGLLLAVYIISLFGVLDSDSKGALEFGLMWDEETKCGVSHTRLI